MLLRCLRAFEDAHWSFGFKLHLVVNDCGELLGCCLTPAHRHDVKLLPKLTKRLFGKLFGDKGYLSQPMCFQDGLRGCKPDANRLNSKP